MPSENSKSAIYLRYFLYFQVTCAVALTVLCVYYYRNSVAFQQSRNWVKHTYNVIEHSLIISILSKSMQWESRNYNLTGTSEDYRGYQMTKDSTSYYISRLAALTADNLIQQSRVFQLQQKVLEIGKLADQAATSRDKNGFNDAEFRRIVNEQIYYYNKIDEILNNIRKEENRLLITREADDRNKLNNKNYTFLGIASLLCLALIGTGVGLIYLFYKSNKNERKIKDSEARFRLLVDSLKDVGIYTINDQGYILNWYEGAHHLKGYKAEEVIGRHFSMFYTDEDKANGEPAMIIDKVIRFGSYESEGWRLRKDGSRFWTDVLVTPMYEKNRELTGLTVVTRNFSEHKRVEQERVQALKREKELNQMKSNFVSLASHEFRTPLSTILSSVSLVEQYEAPENQDKRNKHLQRIKSSIRDMVNTLEEFLSLERIEEGKIIPISAAFNIREFVGRICENISSISKSGHIVTYHHKGDQFIMLDSIFLGHILTNLISNAIKYSPFNTKVLVSSEVGHECIVLKVSDEGIGISADDQRHLFERFFRASNTGDIKGTGLGLHITKRYVELLVEVLK